MNLQELHKVFLASNGVCTDTRKLKKGELFFALRGENYDANLLVEEALKKGCILAVCENREWKGRSEYADRVLVTESALETLQGLANYHRRQARTIVLAITGSNGKTTTKELVAAVLSKKYSVLCTRGNLNNHIGVPLTLLGLKDEEIAVVEMGANHLEEIDLLCKIAEPDLGLITNIGKAHLEGFGSVEGVRKAKGELYDYLRTKDKLILLNASDTVLTEMAEARELKTCKYGKDPAAVVSGLNIVADPFVKGNLLIAGSDHAFTTNLVGKYNINNILAAAAAGIHFELDPEQIIDALRKYEPANNRSQLMKGRSNTLILDAYNANPSSLRASLEEFDLDASAKKIAILGEMLELGTQSHPEHKAILEWLRGSTIDEAMLVGEGFKGLIEPEDKKFSYFDDVWDCIAYLEEHRPSETTILLKGSRKNALEEATNLLLNC